MNNSLVKDNLETNLNFNLKDSKMLVYIHNKNAGKLLNHFKQQYYRMPGFFKICLLTWSV